MRSGDSQPGAVLPGAARLGAGGRLWRAAVAVLFVGTLFYTSSYGGNDEFPMGAMTQFAFRVDSDGGEIRSHWLEADTVTGRHVRLPTGAVGAGLKRAEVEGQMGRFVKDPSLLQGLAAAQHRLRPGEPALTRIYVVKQVKTLEHGRIVSTRQWNEVVWTVR